MSRNRCYIPADLRGLWSENFQMSRNLAECAARSARDEQPKFIDFALGTGAGVQQVAVDA